MMELGGLLGSSCVSACLIYLKTQQIVTHFKNWINVNEPSPHSFFRTCGGCELLDQFICYQQTTDIRSMVTP